MAAASYMPTKLALALFGGNAPNFLATDTFKCAAVVAGSGIPDTSKTGVEFMTALVAANAEVTGTGYTAGGVSLASLTWAVDSTGTRLVDFGFANLTFSQNAAGPTNIKYFVIYKNTGSYTTSQVVLVFDPNATYSMVTGDIVLSSPVGGAIQATV